MADEKITALTALTTPDDADVLPIVDDPSGTPVTKKITRIDLIGAESTFTPTVVGATSGEASYTTQSGAYKRVGNMCHIQIYLAFTKNTISGAVRIDGLPFTIKNQTPRAAIAVARADEITFGGFLGLDGLANSTQLRLIKNTSGAAVANVTDADLHASNQMEIVCSGIYQV